MHHISQARGQGWALALVLALAVALAGFAVACDDDGDGEATPDVTGTEAAAGDEADVEAAVRAAIDAWNGGDLEGFLDAFTDEGVLALFAGFPREVVLEEFGADFTGDPQIEIQELSTDAGATEGTVELTTIEGAFQQRQRLTLIKQGETWLVNDFEPLTQEIPADKTAVDVDLFEYEFDFDPAQITGGNLAFNFSNIGGEVHEMALMRVPADLDIEQALQSEQEPEGVEQVAFVGPWAPDTTLTSILVEDLEPGRYVMFCFVPDAEGTPHALLGMWADFTIDSGATPAQ